MTGWFEWILNGINELVGNYGWSVVLFTLLVRIVLLPLDVKSRKSMRAMNRLQPQVQALQKRYEKDKDKLNQKMSELYKKEHANPLMGCLPMLIQLPILFIMFAAMRNIANEKTGEMLAGLMDKLANCNGDVSGIGKIATDGWLWIKNVFQPDSFGSAVLPSFDNAIAAIKTANIDTASFEGLREVYGQYLTAFYGGGASAFESVKIIFFTVHWPSAWANFQYANGLFILPLFAAVSQLLMTKFSGNPQPAQTDPNQPNPNAMNSGLMKWFFPLFSLYICASYTAAFAIYWAAANVIQIVQQVAINKYLDLKEKKAAEAAADAADEENL